MATLNDIKIKIGAVKKTRQITKAMNMVAAAKLRGAQMRMESFEPYATKFAEVLGNLASRIEPDIHPLLVKKEKISRVELLHFTSDKGLCGSFNSNLINRAEKWMNQEKDNGVDIGLTAVGKRGRDYFKKRGYDLIGSHINVYGSVDISFVNQISRGIIDRYLADEVDGVYMIYSRFISMGRQVPTLVKLLPIEPPVAEDEEASGADAEYLCEPDPEGLMIELLPKHINVQIYNAFLQNETSEHAARMAAMDNASRNCDDLVESLTLAYNKARQAAVTAELMDIVGGAAALKG
ncbi:MAG: ATP synthase F1 subunit gamma [Deltaproteobacteria bacterium]|uniref:ATP synthase gamma chain n=1 Tax=Candidatus Desulfacyla euxinica TaxID=2841693 RepID=A0A8J6N2K3_9DELT|nr:ATP synthase F1 subunit gamma [Candidatus Desulfacyla euxinica]